MLKLYIVEALAKLFALRANSYSLARTSYVIYIALPGPLHIQNNFLHQYS